MRFLIDVIRDGPTAIWWVSKRIEFRKPRVHDPSRRLTYKYVQAKCDGHRVLIVRSFDSGRTHVVTTQGIDISEKLEQCVFYHQLQKKLNDLEWFDGEIYLPGSGREAVTTALAERSRDIRFAAFGHSHTPDSASMEGLQRVIEDRNAAIDIPAWSPIETIAQSGLLRTFRESAETAIDNIKALGAHFDGVVFKSSMYGAWAKQKHQKTIDLIVLGLKPGKGKFAGMCGSLMCGVAGDATMIDEVEIANVSGMDDETRAKITQDDVGRVVEVEYERVGTRGKLQHPRFVAWRDDKQAHHCTLDQDPKLQEYHA